VVVSRSRKRLQNRTKEVAAAETFSRTTNFSGNGQWHSSLLLVMMTIMLVVVVTIVVNVMLVTTMIMDHLLLLLTAS